MGDDQEMGAELAHLVRAGKIFFPKNAALFASLDRQAAAQGPSVQSAADGVGNPAALGKVMSLIDTLQRANQRSAVALEAIGHNLLKVANDFHWTDSVVAAKNREIQVEGLDHVPTVTIGDTPDPYHYRPTAPVESGD